MSKKMIISGSEPTTAAAANSLQCSVNRSKMKPAEPERQAYRDCVVAVRMRLVSRYSLYVAMKTSRKIDGDHRPRRAATIT